MMSKNNRKGWDAVETCNLGAFLDAMVCGTNLHISVVFIGNTGGKHMQRPYHYVVHKKPVCVSKHKTQAGFSSCVRCRMTVQNYIARHGKSLSGYCKKGVYEHCAPVIYQGRTIAVIFIGNIYTGEDEQLRRLGSGVTQSLLDTMEHNYTKQDCENTARVIGDFICLLAEQHGMEEGNHDALMDGIKNYIRENYVYNFSLEDLAEIFGYNAKYLGRLFKHRTGTTVNKFCNMLRIEEAKRLLTETDMRITDIALQTGFNNISYFNYVFSGETGKSPGAYRSDIHDNKL